MTDLPMLAIPSTGSSGRAPISLERLLDRGWIQDLKIDGVRAYWKFGKLINREGVDITHRYPEISLPGGLWLDGEIVAEDGKFETTLLRDQQQKKPRIRALAEEHPCRFIAFDMPDPHFGHADSYVVRREALQDKAAEKGGFAITPISRDPGFLDKVAAEGMEGIIAKRPQSRYQFGRRSKDWVKFKVLHRLTMIAIGYVPGQGQRADFGSMRLALLGDDGPVSKDWRVGSGFTERDIVDLKARLDAGDFFPVEIECVNRTSDDKLRFPVFRGVRTDVPLTACTLDQLEGLPSC